MSQGWPKGKPRGKKSEGSGRKKGVQNKLTVSVRQAFKEAFDYLQEDDADPAHLKNWGKANPKDFYMIAQKLIPQEMSGPDGSDIPVKITVEFVPVDK
jgi:hypothetical protein